MFEMLSSNATNPLFLFFCLIVIAWLWEDATVVCGALLAADELMMIPLAVLAVFVGIFSGDLALFYLGRYARKNRKVRACLLLNPRSKRMRGKFRERTFSNILIIRFIPGLRTLGFTLCGLWKIPLRRFLLAMGMAAVLWIGLVFTLVYRAGSSEFLEHSPWKWSLIGIAFALLVFNNLWSAKSFSSSSKI